MMAARQLCWLPAILFYHCHLCLFCHLISEVTWPIVTKLCHVWWWSRFIKFSQKFGWPLPAKFGGPKTKILARFRATSWLHREYLQTATRHRQRENGIANYGHSRTGKLNWLYFGPQMEKNRTRILTHSMSSHQAGYCHTSCFPLVYNRCMHGSGRAGRIYRSTPSYDPDQVEKSTGFAGINPRLHWELTFENALLSSFTKSAF